MTSEDIAIEIARRGNSTLKHQRIHCVSWPELIIGSIIVFAVCSVGCAIGIAWAYASRR